MKVLFVQEEPFLATALKLTLKKSGYDLIIANSAAHPRAVLEKIDPAILITDITQPGGMDYITEGKIRDLPVIAICANGKEDALQDAFDKGADDYICLPLSLNELALRVSIVAREKKAIA